jgi:hypothetical protein
MTLTLAWLYGILAIASVFITAGMWKLWIERVREPMRPEPDMYYMILLYAGLHGLGGAIWWTIRGWDAVVNGRVNPGSAPWLVMASAILYTVGKGGMVYASSLNGKPTVWRVFVGVSALWSVVVWYSIVA